MAYACAKYTWWREIASACAKKTEKERERERWWRGGGGGQGVRDWERKREREREREKKKESERDLQGMCRHLAKIERVIFQKALRHPLELLILNTKSRKNETMRGLTRLSKLQYKLAFSPRSHVLVSGRYTFKEGGRERQRERYRRSLKFQGPVPRLFSLTNFQEQEYDFHFSDIR